ncbi:MAG TPA: methyltransferase domain-containing protein [Longimicrobiales bacterium]|nr:methyltransferase domain-containing protein [Longimicrobiales bacterium]
MRRAPPYPRRTGQPGTYSRAWFDTFAAKVPASLTAAEVEGITRWAPPDRYRDLIDVGCGNGRVTGHLMRCGYRATGIDVSVGALRAAKAAAPGARYLALDQRHIGRLPWRFDVAVVLWSSFGFGSRSTDAQTLEGVHQALRPGGRLLLDLYHPDWLAANQQDQVTDERGAVIDRWLADGRLFHRIRYRDGAVDEIDFNVYRPGEIEELLRRAGFDVAAVLVWWKEDLAASAEFARYQVVAERPGRTGG